MLDPSEDKIGKRHTVESFIYELSFVLTARNSVQFFLKNKETKEIELVMYWGIHRNHISYTDWFEVVRCTVATYLEELNYYAPN